MFVEELDLIYVDENDFNLYGNEVITNGPHKIKAYRSNILKVQKLTKNPDFQNDNIHKGVNIMRRENTNSTTIRYAASQEKSTSDIELSISNKDVKLTKVTEGAKFEVLPVFSKSLVSKNFKGTMTTKNKLEYREDDLMVMQTTYEKCPRKPHALNAYFYDQGIQFNQKQVPIRTHLIKRNQITNYFQLESSYCDSDAFKERDAISAIENHPEIFLCLNKIHDQLKLFDKC
uniref:Uncharacterized protein n=1 Tax=Rhabditophanes sp. KR3021 TaxID=114890 RepID=A0AC35TNH5_9BILA